MLTESLNVKISNYKLLSSLCNCSNSNSLCFIHYLKELLTEQIPQALCIQCKVRKIKHTNGRRHITTQIITAFTASQSYKLCKLLVN
jgi:hypothetical protein